MSQNIPEIIFYCFRQQIAVKKDINFVFINW